MSKYYLNVELNSETIMVVTSGKLSEIDKFIVKNNINNANDLYNIISDRIESKINNNDTIEFLIEYKHKGEIKQVPIVYKNDLVVFYKNNDDSEFIYNLIQKDDKFKNKFNEKYLNGILKIKEKNSILEYAKSYIKKSSYDNFKILYNALISRKKNNDLDGKSFENAEELEEALTEKVYSYSKRRKLFFDAYFFKKAIPNNKVVVNKYEYEDEFDNEMINDQLPDEYKVTEYKTRDELSHFDEENSLVKKKVINDVYPNQISVWDLKQ